MSTWLYRHIVIVPAADQNTANTLAVAVLPGPAEAEAQTFGLPLSADGQAPATHYGISTLATEAIREAAEAALVQVPNARWYRTSNSALTGTPALLQATNDPTAETYLGQPWSFAATLAQHGLARIQPDINI
jgi:hypothetical protein